MALAHPPRDAQADFAEALVMIGGVEQKGHFQCLDLSYSDDCFVIGFPAENTEVFLEDRTSNARQAAASEGAMGIFSEPEHIHAFMF